MVQIGEAENTFGAAQGDQNIAEPGSSIAAASFSLTSPESGRFRGIADMAGPANSPGPGAFTITPQLWSDSDGTAPVSADSAASPADL
jgi:hypothetical protein